MRVGKLEIIAVSDGEMAVAPPATLPPEDSPEMELVRPHLRADGTFAVALGGFVVRTGDRVILIDTGLGPGGMYRPSEHPERMDAYMDVFRAQGVSESQIAGRAKRFGTYWSDRGALPEGLAQLGIAPDAVTDVVLTHLHPDHIGWLSYDGRPFFPKATVWCCEADAAYFLGPQSPDDRGYQALLGIPPLAERIAPVLGNLRTWTHDSTIAPGIDVRRTPGHTPGSSIVIVSSEGERAMLLGDVVHCPLELVEEDFAVFRDLDPALARASKLALIREMEDGSVHAVSPHFPGLRFGRLLSGQGVRRWTWAE